MSLAAILARPALQPLETLVLDYAPQALTATDNKEPPTELATVHQDQTAATLVETLALLETQLAQPFNPTLDILPHTSLQPMELVELLEQLELAWLDPTHLDLFFQDQELTQVVLVAPPTELESVQPLQAIPMVLHQEMLARLAHHTEPAAPVMDKHKDRNTEQAASVESHQSPPTFQAVTESQANQVYQDNLVFQVSLQFQANQAYQDQPVFRDRVQQVPQAHQVIPLTHRTTTRSEDDRI